MGKTADHSHIPGFRDLLRDISNATGALIQMEEVIDDHGIETLIRALNLGLVVYETDGGMMFVPQAPLKLYIEMIDRLEDGDEDDNNRNETEAASLKATAA